MLFGTVGVTNRLDVSLAMPIVSVRMDATSDDQIIRVSGPTFVAGTARKSFTKPARICHGREFDEYLLSKRKCFRSWRCYDSRQAKFVRQRKISRSASDGLSNPNGQCARAAGVRIHGNQTVSGDFYGETGFATPQHRLPMEQQVHPSREPDGATSRRMPPVRRSFRTDQPRRGMCRLTSLSRRALMSA